MRDFAVCLILVLAATVSQAYAADDDSERRVAIVTRIAPRSVRSTAAATDGDGNAAPSAVGTIVVRADQDADGLILHVAVPAGVRAPGFSVALASVREIRLPAIDWDSIATPYGRYAGEADCIAGRPRPEFQDDTDFDCVHWLTAMEEYERGFANTFVRRWRVDRLGHLIDKTPPPSTAEFAYGSLVPTDFASRRATGTATAEWSVAEESSSGELRVRLPWNALPASDRLNLSEVLVAVQPCVSADAAVPCHGWAGPPDDTDESFTLIELEPARHYRFTRCDYALAAFDTYGHRAPAWFLPGSDEVTDAVYFLRAARPQEDGESVLPWIDDDLDATPLAFADGTPLCDPRLQLPFRSESDDGADLRDAGADRIQWIRGEATRHERPNGDFLLVRGPRVTTSGSITGNGAACPFLSLEVWKADRSLRSLAWIAGEHTYFNHCYSIDGPDGLEVEGNADWTEYTSRFTYDWPPMRDSGLDDDELRRIADLPAASDGRRECLVVERRHCLDAATNLYADCGNSLHFAACTELRSIKEGIDY